MAKYDVTPKYLLKRIHQVAPTLAYSALPMKMELSPKQMQERMEYAEWLYQLHLKDPWLLWHIMWGDETRIYIGQDLLGRLKVYHYPGRYDGQPPIANPLLSMKTTFRLDSHCLWTPTTAALMLSFLQEQPALSLTGGQHSACRMSGALAWAVDRGLTR